MHIYLEFLATLPVMVICYQLYTYSINSTGVERQQRLQKLGIACMAIGITALVAREPALVFMGLVLIMGGFRLMAKGLDRLDKKLFIDRYDGLNNGSEPEKEGKG
jgi:hypothetical protein